MFTAHHLLIIRRLLVFLPEIIYDFTARFKITDYTLITAGNFFTRNITLRVDELTILPLERIHTEPLWRYGREAALWHWTTVRISGYADFQAYVESAIQERDTERAYPVVFSHATAGLIGMSRYGNISFEHRRAEIGWTWLAAPFHHTGVNRKIKFAMVEFLFQSGLFNRIEFKTDALNLQSRRALEKIGAREEGTLRAHIVTQSGRIRDTVYFSILAAEREEWKKKYDELQVFVTVV